MTPSMLPSPVAALQATERVETAWARVLRRAFRAPGLRRRPRYARGVADLG